MASIRSRCDYGQWTGLDRLSYQSRGWWHNAPVVDCSELQQGVARRVPSTIRVGWWADLSRERQTAAPDFSWYAVCKGDERGQAAHP